MENDGKLVFGSQNCLVLVLVQVLVRDPEGGPRADGRNSHTVAEEQLVLMELLPFHPRIADLSSGPQGVMDGGVEITITKRSTAKYFRVEIVLVFTCILCEGGVVILDHHKIPRKAINESC